MLKDWGHDKAGDFAALIWRAVTDPRVFAVFRRDPHYISVVETVWETTGRAYLDRIGDDTVRGICLRSAAADTVGGPLTYAYEDVQVAPTTLRYGKVLCDLIDLFPHFPVLEEIAEIGIGHGGQARIIAEYAHSARLRLRAYTCLDMLPVLLLGREYLEHFRLDIQFRFLSKVELPRDARWDLAISNYAFSEFDRTLQEEYLDRVLRRAEAGYLTMNSGLWRGEWNGHACFTAEELCGSLANAALLDEDPLTAPDNYILVFGRHKAKGVGVNEIRERARARAAEAPVAKTRQGVLARIGRGRRPRAL
jgi:hypothetical protein